MEFKGPFACLKRNVSRAPKEIAKLYDIKLSELNTGIKNVRKLINTDEIINHNMCSPIHFIKRFCNNLNILTCNVEKIINVTNNVEKLITYFQNKLIDHRVWQSIIYFLIKTFPQKMECH